jgi:hypothetical protein
LDHKCFILTEQQKQERMKIKYEQKRNGYIFFDYETYVDVERGIHVPNLIVAKRICEQCLDSSTLCETCSQVYKFDNNIDFCKWLMSHTHTIALAHNLKGYDGVFIANYCINNLTSRDAFPAMIATPTKLLEIKFRGVRIIDSYSFISSALDKFPSTFDIPEMKKGFYPHLFNKPANADYVGPYPDESYYGTQYFSITKKAEFDEFYQRVRQDTFDNRKELHDYCVSDVEILAAGCLKFRQIIMEKTKRDEFDRGVDPFQVSITIASLCNHIYRRNFMKPNTIAVIPEHGYNPTQNTSRKCRQWLRYTEMREGIFIQSADNVGEKRVDKYLLDGYCEETKTAYEFHGCYWHGCPKCYQPATYNTIKNFTMRYIYKCHEERRSKLLKIFDAQGIKLVEKWECAYKLDTASNIDQSNYIKNNPIEEPLIPRDALFGGRTNAFRLHYKCKPGEKIKYYDITSLYPAVQKQEQYPIGHPEILKNPETTSIAEFFGIVKCSVLPPASLYAPVLPARINKKLMFTLCTKCAEDQHKDGNICKHPLRERMLHGTWTTVELQKAIEMGYVIAKIQEVWHWREKGDLFSEYVNTCIKGKQEASDFPKGCETEEQKIQFCLDYYKNEGIKLDYEKIKKNTGARTIFKSLVNNLWGYLAMNCNKTKHKFIKTEAQLIQMMADDSYIIHEVIPCLNNEMMQVYYAVNSEMFLGGITTNVCVASFVTSYGRLRLYNEIEKLGHRCLYFDTDSIIFISRDGEYEPPLGDLLGQFTNEIDPKDGEYIVEFVSAGPKNYAYTLNTGVTKCVVKGICLNRIAGLTINYDSIKNIVCGNQNSKLFVDQRTFKRNKHTWEITTEEFKKCYGFVYDKRQLFPDLTTLPFGFVGRRPIIV